MLLFYKKTTLNGKVPMYQRIPRELVDAQYLSKMFLAPLKSRSATLLCVDFCLYSQIRVGSLFFYLSKIPFTRRHARLCETFSV